MSLQLIRQTPIFERVHAVQEGGGQQLAHETIASVAVYAAMHAALGEYEYDHSTPNDANYIVTAQVADETIYSKEIRRHWSLGKLPFFDQRVALASKLAHIAANRATVNHQDGVVKHQS